MQSDDQHNRPDDAQSTDTVSTEFVEQDDITDRLTGETQQEQLINYGPPTLGIISAFLPWVTVSAPIIGSRSGAGTNAIHGWVLVACAIGFLVAVHMESDRGQLAAGAGALLVVVWSYLRMWWGFTQAQAEMSGGLFAGSIDVSFGIGIHLALVAAVAMAYLGYQRNSEFVDGHVEQAVEQYRN